MNPTQEQDNAPQPRRDADGPAGWVSALRFLAHLGQPAKPVQDEPYGYALTDKSHKVLDEPVRFGEVRGWCEQCGQALPWVCTWDESLCSDCVIVVPADNECGYIVTAPAMAPSTCPVDLVTETDDETTARVLRGTATYLERYGWIQGAYYDATSGSFTPPACMVGGIGMVCYGGPVDAPAQQFDDPGFLDFEAAVLHLDRYLLVEDGSESHEFNDARGRRVEDVTRVLRDAATRPAHELIDALRVIDQHNADTAALADMLVPNGVERCPCCASTRRALRAVIDDGDGAAFCDHDWHDGDSQGGDVR
jgi:hypothetical protein